MNKNNKKTQKLLDKNQISMPKGGGAFQGLKEDSSVDLFTGEGSFRVPIYTTPCRGYEPILNLEYQASRGNGVFGVGFFLEIPSISRMTSRQIPVYEDDSDCFYLSSGGELVQDRMYTNESGFLVRSYFMRKEGAFSQIEYLKKEKASFWKITDRENTVSYYGRDSGSYMKNPYAEGEIYSWLLCEKTDEKGNRTKYEYNGSYQIQSIHYGNYRERGGKEKFAFSIGFSYTEHRIDTITKYNSGFNITVDCLCSKISMVHNLEQTHQVVRDISLIYDSSFGISLLKQIQTAGYKKRGNKFSESRMPDITFQFTTFEPENQSFQKLQVKGDIPVSMGKRGYSLVDLYGEGVMGLLYTDSKAVLYAAPLGEYQFQAPCRQSEFPIYKDLSNGTSSLRSLRGNGRYELVVEEPGVSGFYECFEGGWSPFSPFKMTAREQFSRNKEIVDLQGDRLAHIMVAGADGLRYYPSRKLDGYGPPVERMQPEEFPHVTQNSREEAVVFLNLFGDGLSHRVRIKNGLVECWPNLGYGRFGDKIILEHPPAVKGRLDVNRLLFADLDGSGTTDFIYLYSDKAAVYLNRSGHSFSDPFYITLPQHYTNGDEILIGDINGTGTNSLIFGKMDAAANYHCYDFSAGKKPYLLDEIQNGSGVRTKFRYESSVSCYLRDKKNHVPWKLTAPFPVHLVAEKAVTDEITGLRAVWEYTYRNALYDFEENQFKGFGYVESRETQQIPGDYGELPEIHTKNWFYTGIREEDSYFAGDRQAMRMEDHVVEASERGAAKKALCGQQIRKEVYEGKSQVPFSVEENNYRITEIKAPAGKEYGAYLTYPLQQISYQYEGDASDPCVKHQFNLKADQYGNIESGCEVYYKRRAAEKSRLSAKIVERKFINHTEGNRHLGVLYETKSYEMQGLDCEGYFTFQKIRQETDEALLHGISYGEPFQENAKQARLMEWERHIYWDDAQTEQLLPGAAGARILEHHSQSAVYPEKFPAVTDVIEKKSLETDCGLLLEDGYWWKHSLLWHYDEQKYFLPCAETWVEKRIETTVTYDTFALMPIEYSRYLNDHTSLKTTGSIDYDVMQYREIRDENDNVDQAAYDAFGQLIISSKYGLSDGKWEGSGDITEYQWIAASFEDVLKEPEKYLQDMAGYYYYDWLSWQNENKPLRSLAISSTQASGENPNRAIDETVTYWDALLQKTAEFAKTDSNMWAVKNRKVYSLSGKELLAYPCSFANLPDYQRPDAGVFPVRRYYDGQGRLTVTEKPREEIAENQYGYVRSVIKYRPYETAVFHENSCLEETDYYRECMEQYAWLSGEKQQDRYEVLQKCEEQKGKCHVQLLDSRGNKIADIIDQETGDAVEYQFDMNGNVCSIADARLQNEGKANISYIFDMQGEVLQTDSCDAGITLTVTDFLGNPVHIINGIGFHEIICYDSLMRPIERHDACGGMTEKIIYGECVPDAREKNLMGNVYQHKDQAGIKTNLLYSVRNQVEESVRQLCREYREEIDWSSQAALQEEIYRECFSYNMADKIVCYQAPDGSIYKNKYSYCSQLKQVELLEDGKSRYLIQNICYTPGGKQEEITYGNGVTAYYQYNPVTELLEEMITGRKIREKQETLQSFTYYFDPELNVSRIRDNTAEKKYRSQQPVEPYLDYIYDMHNRLVLASGREAAGNLHDAQNVVAYREKYGYDAGNNLVSITHTSPAQSYTKNFTISKDSNRISKDGDGGSFAYDSGGNMLCMPGVAELSFNKTGKMSHTVLIERQDWENDEEFYVYDHTGSRIRKISRRKLGEGQWEQTERIYLGPYSEKKLVTDHVKLHRADCKIMAGETHVATRYRWLADEENREAGGTCPVRIQYQVQNHLNSISMILNEKAECIRAEEYYPFGITALVLDARREVSIKEYRFCGKELDCTGLYYFNARYYAREYGRMISADSVRFIEADNWQTLNLYAFCKNNPVTYIDPDGHAWVTALLIAAGVILAGVIGYGIYLRPAARPQQPQPPPPAPPRPVVQLAPDLATHIQTVERPGSRDNGIKGGHKMEAFMAEAVNLGIRQESREDVPGFTGVYNVKYSLPTLNRQGIRTGEFNKKIYSKTIYDKKDISDAEYLRRGTEAAQNALDNGHLTRQWTGIDSKGIPWRGYLDENERRVVSFFPDSGKK